MATFEHYKQTFTTTWRDLAGTQYKTMLPEFVDKDNKRGEIAYLDSAGPGADITDTDLKTKKTRKSYEADASKTLEKWNAIHTPHNEINKEKTAISPRLLEWGHTFDEDEDILELIDPTNKTISQGMRTFMKAKDTMIINGISAASVNRVTSASADSTDLQAISLPASQTIDTGQHDIVLLSDLRKICERFEDAYVDEKKFVLINPIVKTILIDNNDKIHDTDFVDRHSYFHEGKLPQIYGLHFIVHPLMPTDKLYAWSKDAIVWNQFKAFESTISKVPEIREGTQAYIREKADCKRVDDLKVVHMTITTA